MHLTTRTAIYLESLSLLFPDSERSPERNCDRRACVAYLLVVACGVGQKHGPEAVNMIHSSQVDAAADGQDEKMADGSFKDMTAVHAL